MPSDALPDDLETLKAMLLAERIQNERLRQIIKELQRHRFGRRAETLPEDQMLLGLEDVELYADIKAGIRKCDQVCAYHSVCGGGAPSNKIYENGSAASTETLYCRTIQRGIDVVLDLMERIPQELARNPLLPLPLLGKRE